MYCGIQCSLIWCDLTLYNAVKYITSNTLGGIKQSDVMQYDAHYTVQFAMQRDAINCNAIMCGQCCALFGKECDTQYA